MEFKSTRVFFSWVCFAQSNKNCLRLILYCQTKIPRMLLPTLSLSRKPYPSFMLNSKANFFKSSLKCHQEELPSSSSTCWQHVTTISQGFLSFCSTLAGAVGVPVSLLPSPPLPAIYVNTLRMAATPVFSFWFFPISALHPSRLAFWFSRDSLRKPEMNMNFLFSSAFLLLQSNLTFRQCK